MRIDPLNSDEKGQIGDLIVPLIAALAGHIVAQRLNRDQLTIDEMSEYASALGNKISDYVSESLS